MINHPNRKRASASSTVSTIKQSPLDFDQHLLAQVQETFETVTVSSMNLFMTDVTGLWDIYLNALPDDKQVHNCRTCRHFIERFGALVILSVNRPISVMWDPTGAPEFYRPALAALKAHVEKGRILGPFFTDQNLWGTPATPDREWKHLSIKPDRRMVMRDTRLMTPHQAMSAAHEKFRIVSTALSEFTVPMLDELIRVLESDTLARSEKLLAPTRWLRNLKDRPKGRAGENALWLSVMTAPEGYCHPKSSVFGPLLQDIADGLPFEQLKSRHNERVDPLVYQRPQVPPAAQTIGRAEEVVAKLGITRSLERRYARLDEVKAYWTPKLDVESKQGGIFGHLKVKVNRRDVIEQVDIVPITMTMVKFMANVVPTAAKIQLMVPGCGPFLAMTTAVHADAPPILKWDSEAERNPVSWYVYPKGSSASDWGLRPHAWIDVPALVQLPTMWGKPAMPQLGDGIVAILEGCADRNNESSGLFPEFMRGELHGIRSVIEAYSRSTRLVKSEGQLASGFDMRKQAPFSQADLCVLSGGAWQRYRIDRWD